jgi:uncharacterized FAD-dependent dehydrogenase
VSNIRLPFTEPSHEALAVAEKRLGHPKSASYHICKKSLDARKRRDICFVYSVSAVLDDGAAVKMPKDPHIRLEEKKPLDIATGSEKLDCPPVIAGFGPAGMFAGLLLALNGFRPVIIEKGPDMDQRVADVEAFNKSGRLNPDANIQFGEGGAGTFSDGKLTTRISDSRCGYILEQLARHGAPDDILYQAKPHIGTDKLKKVIKNIRADITALGGAVHFNTSLTGLIADGGVLTGIKTSTGDLPARALILAPGHSARAVFPMLLEHGVAITSKPFSVGVRAEHLQDRIDRALYGDLVGHPLLPKGEYQFSHRGADRAVYTFCMCPGGVVVPAASEDGGVVTNGMSVYARDGVNANAALVVSVDERDYGSGPLAGVAYQQKLEHAAFGMGGGGFAAPVQDAGSFLAGKRGYFPGKVVPSYARGVKEADFKALFPSPVADMLQTGLVRFGKKLAGFDAADTVLTGVETRTSSPVRIPRGDTLESVSLRGLYPCGEGAGYAGGIMSAAADGVRVAQAIMARYQP